MSNCEVKTVYHTDVGQDSVRRERTLTWQSSADTVTWKRGTRPVDEEVHFEMGEADAFVDAYAEALSRKFDRKLRVIWHVELPDSEQPPKVFLDRTVCWRYLSKLLGTSTISIERCPSIPTASNDTWIIPYSGGTIEVSCLAVTSEIP